MSQTNAEEVGIHDRGDETLCAHAYSYASIGRRLAAYSIDLILSFISTLIPVYLIGRALVATGIWVPTAAAPSGFSWYLAVISGFLSTGPIYGALFHASPWQATLGKRLLKIYVTDNNGKRISLARSFFRVLTFSLLAPALGSLVSVITIAASERRKGLHDFIAKTLVLTGRADTDVIEPWRFVVAIGIPVAETLAMLIATTT